MNNEQLSTEFTILYPTLKNYTTKALYVLKSPLDFSHVLSECYLSLYKIADKIKTSDDLEGLSKNWIKKNIMLNRSPINIQNSVRPNHSSEYFEQVYIYASTPIPDFDDWIIDWEEKLSLEDKVVWNLYYHNTKDTIKKISAHLKISNYIAYKMLRQAKVLEVLLRAFVNKKIQEI